MGKNILVVDDDEAVRKLFLFALEGAGYQIDTAQSGREAIDMAKYTKYNLIYLDLKMPGMSGIEILRELRGIDKDVPIYIITAFRQEFFDELQSAKKDGINFELLLKPFGTEELIMVTNGILGIPESY